MRVREQEVVLGAVVFVAIIIVVVGMVWLSERYAGAAGGYRLHVAFESVSGLQRGNPVTIRGVKAGKVLDVVLVGQKPIVTIGFAELRSLPRDSRIVLKSEGLLGDRVVEIHVGKSSQAFRDGDSLIGQSAGSIEVLTDNAADIATRMNEAIDSLFGEANTGRIEHILASMDTTTANLRSLLRENRRTFTEAVDGLAEASAGAKGLVGENREGVREAVHDLQSAMHKLAASSENLEASSASLRTLLENLDEIAQGVREGKGTLGLLVTDEGLYRSLDGTMAAVDSLVEAIRQDPSRYLNAKFTLF